MQNTSDLYRQILAADNHWYETKCKINNVDYGESSLFSVSTQSSMFSGNPEVGGAISAEIDVSLLAPSVDIPVMAKVEPFVRIHGKIRTSSGATITDGIVDFGQGVSLSSNIATLSDQYFLENDIVYGEVEYTDVVSEWLPQGIFYIDTRETSNNGSGLRILKIHGYDAILFAEQYFPDTDEELPTLDTDVVDAIAEAMGVEVDARTYTLMTNGYTIPSVVGYTMRDTLGYIAAMYVGSFIMTEEGKLRLVSILELPEETNYLIDNAGDAITFGGDRILV